MSSHYPAKKRRRECQVDIQKSVVEGELVGWVLETGKKIAWLGCRALRETKERGKTVRWAKLCNHINTK